MAEKFKCQKIASHKLIERTIYVARVCYCNPTLLVHFECEFHYCSVAFYYRIHNSQMLGHLNKKISLSSVLFYLIFDGLMLFSLLSYIYIYIPFNGQECMLSYSLRLPFYRLNFFYRLLLFYRLFYIFLILFRKVEWLKSGIAS